MIAGDNITIVGNTISSTGGSGGITQADLDAKQDVINDGDLTFAKTAGLVSAINALDKLASRIYVDNELNKKQNKLDATSALSVDRVSTLGDITSGGDLMYYDIFYGSRNVRNVFLQLIQQLILNKIWLIS